MNKSIRTLAVSAAVLLSTAPMFASIFGSNPRPQVAPAKILVTPTVATIFGSNPRPQVATIFGSNPHPQIATIFGSNPRPQAVSTPTTAIKLSGEGYTKIVPSVDGL